MEHIGSAPHSNARTSQGQTLSPQELGSLSSCMVRAKSYFPSQVITTETSKQWLLDWAKIAARYGLTRFESALGNICRRSEWFPLPVAIETECRELKILATEQQGSRLNVFNCECGFQCASTGRNQPTCRE